MLENKKTLFLASPVIPTPEQDSQEGISCLRLSPFFCNTFKFPFFPKIMMMTKNKRSERNGRNCKFFFSCGLEAISWHWNISKFAWWEDTRNCTTLTTAAHHHRKWAQLNLRTFQCSPWNGDDDTAVTEDLQCCKVRAMWWHRSESGSVTSLNLERIEMKQSFLLGFSGNFECRQLVVVFSLFVECERKVSTAHELWALVTGTVVVYGWKLSLESPTLLWKTFLQVFAFPWWLELFLLLPSQHCVAYANWRERCCRHTREKEEKARSQLWPGTCCILLNTHLSLSDFRALTNFPNVSQQRWSFSELKTAYRTLQREYVQYERIRNIQLIMRSWKFPSERKRLLRLRANFRHVAGELSAAERTEKLQFAWTSSSHSSPPVINSEITEKCNTNCWLSFISSSWQSLHATTTFAAHHEAHREMMMKRNLLVLLVFSLALLKHEAREEGKFQKSNFWFVRAKQRGSPCRCGCEKRSWSLENIWICLWRSTLTMNNIDILRWFCAKQQIAKKQRRMFKVNFSMFFCPSFSLRYVVAALRLAKSEWEVICWMFKLFITLAPVCINHCRLGCFVPLRTGISWAVARSVV